MNRTWIAASLIAFAVSTVTTHEASATGSDENEWVNYAEEANGDLYFYDMSRVEKTGTLRQVWNGVRYKTSLMGAFSFLSHMEIDCSKRTEKTLQSTFFTDEHWERPAMKTNSNVSASRQIEAGSTSERLAEIVCD